MPLTSISVKNHKAIKGELTLKNLKSVNYLVGANGSGKSSILEYIYLACNDLKLRRRTLGDYIYTIQTIIERENFRSENLELSHTLEELEEAYLIRNSFLNQKNLQIEIVNNYKQYLRIQPSSDNPIVKITKEFTQKIFQDLNSSLISCNLYSLDLFQTNYSSKIRSIQDLHRWVKNYFTPLLKAIPELQDYLNIEIDSTSFIIYDKSDKHSDVLGEIRFDNLGEGLQWLYKLIFYCAFPSMEYSIYCIEEPEIFLHPKLQKLLPKIYEYLSSSYNIQFFISTHSPFVINASGEFSDTQNVYLIENGKCQNPEGCSGYQARDSAREMLGYSDSEFLPAKIVFCEDTLVGFLTIINNRFYHKDIIFKRPKTDGGDATILGVKTATELVKKAFENILFTEFLVVLDTPNTNNEKNQAQSLKQNYPKSVVILEMTSFEAKFNQDPDEVLKQQGGKKQNGINKANELKDKVEFEKLFPEFFYDEINLF